MKFSRLIILKDLAEFIIQRKNIVLAPIVLFLVLIGLLLVVTEGSVIAPFIYALF